MQEFTAPLTTTYKIECWGAQGCGWGYSGGQVPGGKGGYARGTYSINKEQNIYIAVGGEGQSSSWNGGGRGTLSCPGGGATSIQKSLLSDGQLYRYESVKNTDVLIVAGGGGGSEWYYSLSDIITPTGGAGGGMAGVDGSTGYVPGDSCPGGKGGTQDAGGKSTGLRSSQSIVDGSFGKGGYSSGGDGGGQGGGGWYGGGAADLAGGGGGGSGHINTLLISNGVTIAGDQTFPSPSGGTETGHEGDGFCIITWQQLP